MWSGNRMFSLKKNRAERLLQVQLEQFQMLAARSCEVIPQPGSGASISCWKTRLGTPPPNSALARRLHPNPGENSPCSFIPGCCSQKRPAGCSKKILHINEFYFVGVESQPLSFRVSNTWDELLEYDIFSPSPHLPSILSTNAFSC